jgi:hypothetical protein
MKPRAFVDLSQLTDTPFLRTVSDGMRLIAKHIRSLEEASSVPGQAGIDHAGRILRMIADEEAGKYLILFDAVRCPREPADRLRRQLKYCGQHLAKAIYGVCYGGRPATFREVREYADCHRPDLYLDGPIGVEWIFRNDLIASRDTVLYVDYADTDDGHRWLSPGTAASQVSGDFGDPSSPAIRVVAACNQLGLDSFDALRTIANIWRPIVMADTTHWRDIYSLNVRTLQELAGNGLMNAENETAIRYLMEHLMFPMYDLDLSPIPVSRADLERRRSNWNGWPID